MFACHCPKTKELKEKQITEYENSECVFIGEIINIDIEKRTFEIKVIESFKGSEIGVIYNGNLNSSCGPRIRTKGKWLMYGNFYNSNTFTPNECGLSRSFKKPEFGHYKILKPKSYAEMEYWDFILKIAKKELDKEIQILRKKATE
tara:strand:+ start:142 stop:579 length:438 start_codon:yes stop_codon:yes gene_type:complete